MLFVHASQEIKVQERMQCLAVGSVPSSISVLLQDEMADSCQPGGEHSSNSSSSSCSLEKQCMHTRVFAHLMSCYCDF